MRTFSMFVALALIVAGVWYAADKIRSDADPIVVGILHSQTGTMKISEESMIDAELLAIEEINQSGGLLGRPIKPIVVDGASDWPTYAKGAEKLIREDQVCTIFGCWTSASRKSVKEVVEKYKHLLVYPMAYEGLEQSENIIYTGAAPNQQITPAVRWSFDNLGKKFFLVGSDYIWPRCVNEIVKDQLKTLGAELTGEEYRVLSATDFGPIVAKIKEKKPNVIFSAVVGGSNLAFYRALREAGITPDDIPTVSVSFGEDELRNMTPVEIADMVGNYSAWSYFQSINRTENAEFVRKFRARYGEHRVTNDVMEAAYFSVKLWAQAVQDCGYADIKHVEDIRRAFTRQSLNAPEGVVSIDPDTQHTWKVVNIARLQPDGQFKIVWTSDKPIRPVPYPISRTKAEWHKLLDELYAGWNNTWSNPKKPN